MLNGIAPLLVFTFTNDEAINAVKSVPLVGNFLAENVGLPIPLYLDEYLTGIYVQGESKAIDIETKPEARNDGEDPIVNQRLLNSVTTVTMVASKKGVLLMTLLAFADVILSRVVSKQYKISYFNGPTIIINGLLHGFTTQQGDNDDLVRIEMLISKIGKGETSTVGQTPSVAKVTGVSPTP